MQDFWVVHLRGLEPRTHCNIRVAKLRGSFDSVNEQKTALFSGAPQGTRTPDPLIKSQLLYQLS